MGFYIRDGKRKEVKNLGWFFRYAREKSSLDLIVVTDKKEDYFSYEINAYFRDGTTYTSAYSDLSVMEERMLRPMRCLHGSKLTYKGRSYTIDSKIKIER